jgi:hypothetical protein
MTLLLSVNENDAKRVSIGIIYQCIHQPHRLTAPRLNDRERERFGTMMDDLTIGCKTVGSLLYGVWRAACIVKPRLFAVF